MYIGVVGSHHVNSKDAINKIEEILHIYNLQYGKDIQFIIGSDKGIDELFAKMAYQMLYDIHIIVSNSKYINSEWSIWHSSYEMMQKSRKINYEYLLTKVNEVIAMPSCNETEYESIVWKTIQAAERKEIKTLIEKVQYER